MKAIILCAGYATRLRPLTENQAKPLLPLANRPIIDYIYDAIAEVDDVDAVHVVTNNKFATNFEQWAANHNGRVPITVHNDGTLTNEDRLGAIGDIRFTVERAGLMGDDLLIIAGDNLFDLDLNRFVTFWRGKGDGSAIALYQFPDMELVKQYSTAELDPNERITAFIEKPENPTTNLVGIATYIYHRDHVPLVERYLSEGNGPDQPGKFIAWLHQHVPVYGYRFEGMWLDIGNKEQLLHADNQMRERAGLPTRDTYSVDPE
jgi:glucose-1-phosphate thymidylyltransferase